MNTPTEAPAICILGDVHGHLQLALGMAALWQHQIGRAFEAVLLCGDIGTFTEDSQLDSSTRSFSKSNPCELEFLTQWSVYPQPEWISRIFAPSEGGGLGLSCPVVMVHGNHEGFAHLETLFLKGRQQVDVPLNELPAVDSEHHIRYLPSGWTTRTRSGIRIAGIGGIQPGQRRARYHPMAYLDEDAVLSFLGMEPVEILITHQGPAAVQGSHGSEMLDILLERKFARFWFHGHSTPVREAQTFGTEPSTTVIPLGDVCFGKSGNEPGKEGWCWIDWSEPPHWTRERPECWRDFRKTRWIQNPDGLLICPALL